LQSSASLTISDLWIERGERDLCRGLSFDVRSGEVLRILGENGTGKSSLLKAIVGVITPIEGTIYYLGKNVTQCRDVLIENTLYIGHAVGVKRLLSVEENLRWYCPDVSSDELNSTLEHLGLRPFRDTLVTSLSAGQTKRVALARLWLSEKTLWLLDEPFASLDAKGCTILESRIQQHVSLGGFVVLTTHQDLRLVSARDVVLLS
jgi:heme exporter protein A